MKKITILILAVLLAACSGISSDDNTSCSQEKEICVKLAVIEPIVWGKPITLSITIIPEKDFPDINISIFHDGFVAGFETPISETVDKVNSDQNGIYIRTIGKANQPTTIIQKLLLAPKEGLDEISVNVSAKPHYVINTIEILYNRQGGEVNPPSKRDLGTLRPVLIGRSKDEGGYKCSPGPCLTITVNEPVRWGEPVKASLQILGDKDFPQLGISVFSTDPYAKVTSEKGDFKDLMTWQAGFWWLTDVFANQPQDFTFMAIFPDQEGAYHLQAQAYDLAMGIVSLDAVEIHLSREGGKVYQIMLGTPVPENTYPPRILLYTPTPELSPTATPQVYPPPEQSALFAPPTAAAYPPPQEPALPSASTDEASPTPQESALPITPADEVSPTPEEPLSSPTSTPTIAP
jgi:hypothetical protein